MINTIKNKLYTKLTNDKKELIINLLEQLEIGDCMYLNNATQPYKVIAKSDEFIIAARKTYQAVHLAFDIKNGKCGYFLNFMVGFDFENPSELKRVLKDLDERVLTIVNKHTYDIDKVLYKIKHKGVIVYGN